MTDLKVALAEVVAGELRKFGLILSADHSDLVNSATLLPPLIIARHALTRVLLEWKSGIYTAEEVQRWASFIRRGYVEQMPNNGFHALDIDYNNADETLMVGVIARLDEIGDIIDGVVDEMSVKKCWNL